MAFASRPLASKDQLQTPDNKIVAGVIHPRMVEMHAQKQLFNISKRTYTSQDEKNRHIDIQDNLTRIVR
jgi:hypothetical protein